MSTTETGIQVPGVFSPTAGLAELRTVTVPVVTPKPIASPPVPQHPFMAPNGKCVMHNDAYMTDAYTWRGPLGGTLQVALGKLDGLCATLLFDAKGRIITVCTSIGVTGASRSLLLIDPRTMAVLASHHLPGGGGGGSGFGSGGYIYLDHRDRAVIPTAAQTVEIFEVTPTATPTWHAVAQYNLAAAIGDPSASIQSALPDWSGNIWFVTDTGKVGYVSPSTGAFQAIQLASPEQIGNSFAVDESGGVFIVSNYAQYRFDVGPRGEVQVTWRYTYDRGSYEKPGQHNFGSGTTPTLIGKSWLGITDNADPQMHVVVYHREKEYPGNRIAAQVPVFRAGQSCTENSLIALAESFVVENNYGYTGTWRTPTSPVTPGLARVAIAGGGSVTWANDQVVIPTVVSKASNADGLVYSYTLKQKDGREDWFVTAVDAHTGKTAWEVYAGSGIPFDNYYASLYVGPDGTIYVPVWSGIVRVSQV